MSTIIVFTVPLSRLTWCLQLNDDQLLEESFKGLLMLQWRLVQSNGKYRGGVLELVYIQEILPPSASSWPGNLPSAGLGLTLVLCHRSRLWKKQKGNKQYGKETRKRNGRNGEWRRIMWSPSLILFTNQLKKPPQYPTSQGPPQHVRERL